MLHFEAYIPPRIEIIITGLCYTFSNINENENSCALAMLEPSLSPGNRVVCLTGGFYVFE